jgi:hypothetical protein
MLTYDGKGITTVIGLDPQVPVSLCVCLCAPAAPPAPVARFFCLFFSLAFDSGACNSGAQHE